MELDIVLDGINLREFFCWWTMIVWFSLTLAIDGWSNIWHLMVRCLIYGGNGLCYLNIISILADSSTRSFKSSMSVKSNVASGSILAISSTWSGKSMSTPHYPALIYGYNAVAPFWSKLNIGSSTTSSTSFFWWFENARPFTSYSLFQFSQPDQW